MTQVTIPPSLGGSGITYSDDGTGARDMRNGGHRQWLLPMVGEQIAAAQAAATSAQDAAGSATLAGSLAGTAITGTSTTSLAVGTGSRSLTIEAGRAFVPGMLVRIGDAAAPNATYMDGEVTGYVAGTGALTVNATVAVGSGTLANWTVRAAPPAVLGGAASPITSATTLAADTARVRPVSMAAASQSVTLPPATSLSLGGVVVALPNVGARPFGVRDNAGTLLTAVEPGGCAELWLRANGTAAGSWTVTGRDLSPALTICDATLPATLTQTVEVAVRLTDTLSLHFARNASGHPFVFAVDHGTVPATVGTAVLIVASNLTVEHAFRISATKAMFKLEGTSSNVFNVTVSGTTCTVSSAATAAVFDAATFTEAPLIAALTDNLFVALDLSGSAIRAQAVDTSGAAPVAGSSVNVVAAGGQATIGIYRVTDTTALALYVDDSGTAGSPFSVRGVVLSLSGTTITVGTSAGINDVVSAVELPSCQLTATSYVIGYYQSAGTLMRAVHVGVTGIATAFGTPLTVETASLTDATFPLMAANRFQPNLYRLSDTTALFTYGNSNIGDSAPCRHVVLTNTGGTLTAGTILYGLWTVTNGGNFPQAADGFLAFNETAQERSFSQITVSGTSLSVTGTFARVDVPPTSGPSGRFGLSGGVRGMMGGGPTDFFRRGTFHLFRSNPGGAPRYLGPVRAIDPDANAGVRIPVEVAPSRAAFTTLSASQTGSTTAAVKLAILEFAA